MGVFFFLWCLFFVQATKIIKRKKRDWERGKNELNLFIHADNAAAVLGSPLKTMKTMAIMMMMKLSAKRYSPSTQNCDVRWEKNTKKKERNVYARMSEAMYLPRVKLFKLFHYYILIQLRVRRIFVVAPTPHSNHSTQPVSQPSKTNKM